jgi:hypothetical protein
MSKELPYFKFYINEWVNGDITLENYELQGLFINICSYYWSKECDLSITNLNKKFRGYEMEIDELLTSKIIKLDGDMVKISFLNEQLQSKEVQKITNKRNGSKGGRPPKKKQPIKTENKPNGLNLETETVTETKPNDNPIETNIKERIEKNNIDDVYTPPTTVFPFYTIKQFESEVVIGENEFTLLATRQSKHGVEDLKIYLSEFITQQKALSKLTWPNVADARRHFISWAGKQKKTILNANSPVSTEGVRRVLN